MPKPRPALCFMVPLLVGWTGLASGGERSFVLREHLGVAWQDELLTFAFDFPAGECHPDSLRLEGPSGPIPVQIVRSRPWTDETPHLRSATVGFCADLGPLANDRYVLTWHPNPSEATAAAASTLTIRTVDGLVAVASPAFGAVFRIGGEEFSEPRDAAAVPGPVREMLLPDGRRFGGSRLYGSTRVVSWSGSVIAAGPVFADLHWRYRYTDGTEALLRARLSARDSAIYWDMACTGKLPDGGWDLLITNGLPPLSLAVQIEHNSQRKIPGKTLSAGDFVDFPIAAEPSGALTSLTPWADWFDDRTQTVVVLNVSDGSPAFFAASRDPAVWIEPQNEPGKAWGRIQKSLPLVKGEDGVVTLRAPVMDQPGGGLRRWMTGVPPANARTAMLEVGKSKLMNVNQQRLQLLVDKRRLDWVKDFVLEWPAGKDSRHPMLIVNREDIRKCRARRTMPADLVSKLAAVRGGDFAPIPEGADGIALAGWLLTGSSRSATELRVLERARQRLGLLGDFDLMRSTMPVAALYDGVIDSELVSEPERRLMRARMAYLGYRIEDPTTWSPERGYSTGQPNMLVSYALARGIVACALADHPRAAVWVAPAIEKMDQSLEEVGSRGEWMEGASYDHVTASTMIAFAIAAKNAGFRDYSRHEKFRSMLEYMAKQYSPPDTLRGNHRVTPPFGRANAGLRSGLFGVMASFTRDAVADYSAAMQWMWQQSGSLYQLADNRLCGLEYLYIDPELPSRRPQWGSESFPRATVVMRNGFGGNREDYVNILGAVPGPHLARPSEAGALLEWFAYGRRVAGAFVGGYAERHELLMSRVVPAACPTAEQWRKTSYHTLQGGVQAFAARPRLDYLDARYTIEDPATIDWAMPPGMPAWPPVAREAAGPIPWRRQVLFVKGPGSSEPAYLVFRDTVEADQPTMWQMWTLTNGIRAAREQGDTRSPPPPVSPARQLRGPVFTALGQEAIDLDFFVITPREPTAYTLRWGTKYDNPPDVGFAETRDLLQLQQQGAGEYLVVVLPRRRGDPSPTVTSEADGRAIRVKHAAGTDLIVFADERDSVTIDADVFQAPITLVQRRRDDSVVTLGNGGHATVGGRTINSNPRSDEK